MVRPAFNRFFPLAQSRRINLLFSVILSAVFVVAILPPIPQDPAYHAFADNLTRFGLPNAFNVLSNAAFVLAGLVGLRRVYRLDNSPAVLRWRCFFASIILVGFGSAYYHWSPANDTLFWDRLPMTLGFSTLVACLLAERLGEKAGRTTFVPLLLLGCASVIYWWLTETIGAGDLRPYILAQYLPMALTPLLMMLFPKGSAMDRSYWLLLIGYALAKGLESQDIFVFQSTYYLVSGHTLKHIAAAVAILLFQPQIARTD